MNMKIKTNGNYEGSVANKAKGVQKYSSLPAERKREIQQMTFVKVFLYFWFCTGQKSHWIREKAVKVKKSETNMDINAVLDSEKVSDVVTVKTKAVNEQKKPRAIAKVRFSFDDLNNVLSLEVIEVNAANPADAEHYRKSLLRELKDAKTEMDFDFGFEMYLKYFFGTLKATEVANIEGSEAVLMYRIYKRAIERYPLFKAMSQDKQLDVLDRGLRKARAARVGSRDIHYFAKCTFEVFAEEGLINKVIREDHVTGKLKTYYKVSENRRDRVNPDNHSQVWERNCLIFATYKDLNGIQTSFLAFDLWNMLAQSNRVDAGAIDMW